MNVYLVRHGQSQGNLKGQFQHPESPLSTLGKEQAKILAGRLKRVSFDIIYSSPLERARQTSEIISRELGKPVEFWEDIQETRNPNEILSLSSHSSKAKRIKKLIKENFHKEDWRYSDEETFGELSKRGNRVIKHLLRYHKAQNVLCVSHAGMIKMILAKMIFGDTLTPEIFWNFKHHLWAKNTGITVCGYVEEFGWLLETWNDTAHL
ncbi:MAG: Alpha-ribazole phosphatase [Candidatus Woesebacteria bacterium GW2011_GWC2_47_16]|uniref:Alpha-ribazole phosphatase n=9 Tax=Candidatus Woeseibacteriota TaxID=1752722 RepID=A0A0G1QU07_9BACT|nr:MAG: Alpha-ribazole phosphatase [Candidatus Woesebacteria bacterium GW2011_GWE1_45_18]KKU25045.1 MAG: Alpha-ribazole phosphatase [Candidatus Woesebacteria bacterium GW2011_GWF1_46_13]KKU48476.1 MAG: Alpha-ribazole phosphatase [Candidatus Woesebacteria bacterium GW2011_GWF2_46_8]KKU64685.1 MAG: Alpha-ribazole phosphatase [Candidatus Woesebacteria bacterium GW2011_GWC2_47_16]KKU70931.1 MAG: Alpha-ribazole phosphatase [Candidatus Woesebacteria bacterium GW2011_GWD1_47_21]OGM78499.1 MAG: hypoth